MDYYEVLLMSCAWCESDFPMSSWVHLRLGREVLLFCHIGCLVHWLFGKEPAYFEEIADACGGFS